MKFGAVVSVSLATAFLQSAFAAEKTFCQPITPPVQKVVKSPDNKSRSYWSHMIDNRYLTCMDAQDPKTGENPCTMLDLETGKEVKGGSYAIDPYPTPDGKFLTHPAVNDNVGGLTFYDMKTVHRKGFQAKPLFTDKKMDNVYQSVGLVSMQGSNRNTATRTYRVINYEDMQMRDYRATFNADGSAKNIVPLGQVKNYCQNLRTKTKDYDRDTPMLSKDGSMVSLATEELKKDGKWYYSTKIFKLNGTTGHCTLVKDLGFRTSKVLFDYKQEWIGYLSTSESNDPLKRTSGDKNAFITNLKTGETINLTPFATDAQTIGYPTFFPDGKRLTFQLTQKDDNGRQVVNHAIVDIQELKTWQAKLNQRKTQTEKKVADFVANCQSDPGINSLLENLQKEWNQECDDYLEVQKNGMPLKLLMGLNPKQCQELIGQFWSKQEAKLKEKQSKITKAMLAGLCASESLSSSDKALSKPNMKSLPLPGFIGQKCMGCHNGNSSHPINFANLKNLNESGMGRKIIDRMRLPANNAKVMPPKGHHAGAATNSEINEFSRYLRGELK